MSKSLSKESAAILLTQIASIEIKFAAIPISRYEPIVGALEVIAPQQLIDAAPSLEEIVGRAALKFQAQLLDHLRSLQPFDAQATELQQVNLRG